MPRLVRMVTALLASLALGPAGASAAEVLVFRLEPREFRVRLAEIEAYASGRPVSNPLLQALSLLGERGEEQLRSLLSSPYQLDAAELRNVLAAPMLQDLLGWLGSKLRPGSGGNGAAALQQALLNAADQGEPLTVPDLIAAFPSREIHIDLDRALAALLRLLTLEQQTRQVVQAMAVSGAAISDQNRNRDPRREGPHAVTVQALNLRDAARGRTLQADLYLPEHADAAPASIPVIAISHGLGSTKQYYGYVAEHMASHGYAVVAVQHPGSDASRLLGLVKGTHRSVFDVSEFIDRPLDVSHVLDHLTDLNDTTLNQALRLNDVGVFGNSFGGYTALALAGAEIDTRNLRRDCDANRDSINVSLLLQCRALLLGDPDRSLREERVGAVLTINPVNSSLFGPGG
ncbi:alpha/beta hydrolase [Synechococcus sp. RSCCF101]|uniref:alpha/beta hydrolase n=1 Tax=Synechococcus sp. RSCCF101 TaxID=2511069 RepID=UPI00177FF600|nr:alpha/beta hydrolase [Synechococcus sp. RSCCF101]